MEIIVEGKGNAFVTPNEVILNLNFYIKGPSYNEVLTLGVNNVQNFINELLIPLGFNVDDMKTRNIIIREEEKYDEISKTYIKDGFTYNQEATLKFDYNKNIIARIIENISLLKNPPTFKVNFSVKNKKECQKQILKLAYQNAQNQAQTIAEAAGKTLKQCIKVDFKPFNTEYISPSNFNSELMLEKSLYKTTAQTIINTFTPEDIELSETLYCLWITE